MRYFGSSACICSFLPFLPLQMLINIFLYHFLDDWSVREVKSRLKGKCFLICFADDCVIGFESEAGVIRVMDLFPKRFKRF